MFYDVCVAKVFLFMFHIIACIEDFALLITGMR